MQSLVSGKIARLVLIQLQFVKKELLVAMQAIDDLFNANQVNLQLLAITPAVLSIIALNIVYKTLLGVVRATSQGRKVESSVVIYGELREGIRQLERVLLMSEANGGGFNGAHGSGWDSANTICDGGTATATATTHTTHTDTNDWSTEELGRALSMLHRLQNTLVHNTNVFDRRVLAQVQVWSTLFCVFVYYRICYTNPVSNSISQHLISLSQSINVCPYDFRYITGGPARLDPAEHHNNTPHGHCTPTVQGAALHAKQQEHLEQRAVAVVREVYMVVFCFVDVVHNFVIQIDQHERAEACHYKMQEREKEQFMHTWLVSY